MECAARVKPDKETFSRQYVLSFVRLIYFFTFFIAHFSNTRQQIFSPQNAGRRQLCTFVANMAIVKTWLASFIQGGKKSLCTKSKSFCDRQTLYRAEYIMISASHGGFDMTQPSQSTQIRGHIHTRSIYSSNLGTGSTGSIRSEQCATVSTTYRLGRQVFVVVPLQLRTVICVVTPAVWATSRPRRR